MKDTIGAARAHYPAPPRLSAGDLLAQFWLDIYGKEVQSAATYSYLWMADQMGHVCIGLLLNFAFTAVAYHLPFVAGPWGDQGCEILGFLITAAIVSYWEFRAFSSDVKAATGRFPLDRKLLRSNAIVAAAYMIVGGAVGWAFHNSVNWAVPACLVLVAVAIFLAPPWLRQKIVWQKAALPYLARLADSTVKITQRNADRLWSFIEANTGENTELRQVVIGGPVGSGRTSLASGVGTELAFRGASVRYIGFAALVEFAATGNFEDGPFLPGPANIGYWPWPSVEFLVIDDMGPVIAAANLPSGQDAVAAFKAWLQTLLGPIAPSLGGRNSIWIIGDRADSEQQLSEYATAIASLLGGRNPLPILLGNEADAATEATAAVHAEVPA